jgi:cyclopropane fatty-acyl-phospholipid synthase-like methyltransferase
MDRLPRTPEPELMDSDEQAAAYSDADFAGPHQAFADEAVRRFPELAQGNGRLLDLGCGPADVTVRLARACPGWTVTGVDGAEAMLTFGRARVTSAGLADRVRLERVHLPSPALLARRFDALASNSLLHHLADPAALWAVVATCLPPGAPVVVMDLCRPAVPAAVDDLVAAYAAGEPPVLRDDFRNSLVAAYRTDEVVAQLDGAGLGHLTVEPVSDRHLLVSGRR